MNGGQAYCLSANSPPRGTRADPLCVGYVRDGKVFSLISSLPSSLSANDVPSLFEGFIGVGSEEARLRAGLRPPLKLHVHFSRMQLSRRLNRSEMPTKEFAFTVYSLLGVRDDARVRHLRASGPTRSTPGALAPVRVMLSRSIVP